MQLGACRVLCAKVVGRCHLERSEVFPVGLLTGEDVDNGTDDDFEVVLGGTDDAECQCDQQ